MVNFRVALQYLVIVVSASHQNSDENLTVKIILSMQ